MRVRCGDNSNLYNNTEIRLLSLNKCAKSYIPFSKQIRDHYSNQNQDNKTLCGMYSLGNNIELSSLFKDAIYSSRELLDIILHRLNHKFQSAKDFNVFFPKAMNGEYDHLNLKTINFFKTHFDHLFHIRAIRNQIKESPNNIEFVVMFSSNDYSIMARCTISVNKNIKAFQYLNTSDNPFFNLNKVMTQSFFNCSFHVDLFFSQMLCFWNHFLHLLEDDIQVKDDH